MTLNGRKRAEDITSTLFSKQGQIATEIAVRLLNCEPGDAIMRVQEYAAELEASAGTIHSALRYLQDVGAAKLKGRGRLGTFVDDLNYPILWTVAFSRPFVGAMPLPYTKRFEGLATGVRGQFADHPLDLDLRFMRGSTNRLQKLVSRQLDWVMLSRFAAETANVRGFEVDVVMTLGKETYTVNHVLLSTGDRTAIEDGMRVGIDTKSPDHAWVVRTVCRGRQVEFVEIDYSQGLQLLEKGQIDITVWTREDLPAEFDDLTVVPLGDELERELEPLSEAAIVVDRDNSAAAHVLSGVLDLEQLHTAQQAVIDRAQLPTY